MKKHTLIALISLPLAVFGACEANATADAQQEISTAITQANYAKKTTNVREAHLYLHHVINCLVGTNGADFDANAGDPCVGSGNGAINDYKGDYVNKALLREALQEARYGLLTNQINIAQNAADLSEKSLQAAKPGS